jgi:hypothetical protein
MRHAFSEENHLILRRLSCFNLNVLKKVEIKAKFMDFNKYMSFFKTKLETERKSICDFMNC